jgi:antitoxin CptB
MNDLINKARLRFLCRRGMKELDYILQPFFNNCYNDLVPSLQDQFAALLDLEEKNHSYGIG